MTVPDSNPMHGYDSALEFRWASTLRSLGLQPELHPFSLSLPNGEYYEPDFLLRQEPQDFLLEVKGAHQERIHKPYLASETFDLPVIILNPGYISPSPQYNSQTVEFASWNGATQNYSIRPNVGFISIEQIQEGDYIPASLYYYIRESHPSHSLRYQPLDFPHHSQLG